MTFRRSTIALFFVAISACASATALADVIPPAGECENKPEGTACKDFDGKAGACGSVSYTRTFHSPVPGTEAQTSTSTYFGCKAGATPTKKSSSSCSVSNVGASSKSDRYAFTLLFGALGLALVRRSRSRRNAFN